MAKYLIIFNDPPYGNEKVYNGLRYAITLSLQKEVSLRLFLIGDSVVCAKKGQKVPSGFYNTEIMLNTVAKNNVEIGVCGTCIDARGIKEEELIEVAHKSSMAELTKWTLEADKVISF